MTELPPSPWAQRGQDDVRPDFATAAPPDTYGPIRSNAPDAPSGGQWGAGNVTGGPELTVAIEPIDPDDAESIDDTARMRRIYKWFGGVAAGVVAIGVVILLALVMTGRSPFHHDVTGPPDVAPPLAKACPPPSSAPVAPQPPPPTPKGDRTVDARSGISYKAFASPWRTWTDNWGDDGELQVSYRTGQYFVTEIYPQGDYLASILSGSVPATDNDALALDLKCTGHRVAADVRAAHYPQPNTQEMIKDQQVVLGGRPAWLDEFRLHFDEPGLKAKDELVAIALIDVGRPEAAVLYISIPGTHRQYDYVVDEVLASVRPITR
jgi:hypothetical protein